MDTSSIKFYIKVVPVNGVYQVIKGELDEGLEKLVHGYDILITTRDYKDACRAYTAAQAGINANYLQVIDRISGFGGSHITLFGSVGEFKWNPDADWQHDNNDGA